MKSGKMGIVLFFPRFLLSVGLKTARAWDFRPRRQVETYKSYKKVVIVTTPECLIYIYHLLFPFFFRLVEKETH